MDETLSERLKEAEAMVSALRKSVPPEKSLAEQMHDASATLSHIDNLILDIFEKYEPEIEDFHTIDDDYDNSIEIFVDTVMPYPYEPCWQTRIAIYEMGFSIVYWNFSTGENGKFPEEIRGSEPRRIKMFKPVQEPSGIWCCGHIHLPGIGYVDDRFDEKVWVGSKYDCRQRLGEFLKQKK
jgi:hypothetical protein